MELKNQPRLGLELRLNKKIVIVTLSAAIISAGSFIYSNLSSSHDSLADTQSDSNFSCIGPAGIGDNSTNRFCYDLDSLNYQNNEEVSEVPNIGGNGTSWSQSNVSSKPLFKTGDNGFNGHPVLEFDGNDDFLAMTDQNDLNKAASSERTYTIVFKTSDNISDRQVLYEEGGTTRGINLYIYNNKLYLGMWNRANDGNDAPWVFKSVDSVISTNTKYIVTLIYDGSTDNTTSGRMLGYLNSGYMGSATGVGKLYGHSDDIGLGAMNQNSYFENGSGNGTKHYFKGKIATFVQYNYALDSADRTILENSLSTKFDIDIANDLYTHETNGFEHNLAGIGRTSTDFNNCASAGSLIEINDPSSLDVGDFLLFAYNLDNGATTNNNPDSITSRWNKSIQLSEQGDVGTVDIRFNLDIPEFDIQNGQGVRLLIDLDGDGNMQNASRVSGVYDQDSKTIFFDDVTIGNNTMLTIGTIGSENALPVEFLYVKASWSMDDVDLKWATAMEENNSHFVIERTHDGSHWEVLDEIAGAGNSMNVLTYYYTDYTPYHDVNFYRIKQVDFDGKYEYSEVVMANKAVEQNGKDIKLFPNPAKDMVFIETPNSATGGKISIVDIGGRIVRSESFNSNEVLKLDVQLLPSGVYFVKLQDTDTKIGKRLVIKH